MDDSWKNYKSVLGQYKLPIILGMGGLVLLLYGLIQSIIPLEKNEVVFKSAQDASASASVSLVLIDVAGAVENPGVYELPADSRVQDALIASGGMSKNADRAFVAKNFNLATKISDGGKIYVPFEGDSLTSSGQDITFSAGSSNGGPTVLGTNQSGLVNINSASVSELDTLPGVGPVTADKIISNRPYKTIEELVSKKAVGSATFEKIKDKIQVF